MDGNGQRIGDLKFRSAKDHLPWETSRISTVASGCDASHDSAGAVSGTQSGPQIDLGYRKFQSIELNRYRQIGSSSLSDFIKKIAVHARRCARR